jgi:hypothetical protein
MLKMHSSRKGASAAIFLCEEFGKEDAQVKKSESFFSMLHQKSAWFR